MRIEITTPNHSFTAELFDTPTGGAILATLPFEGNASTWGDEIYFGTAAVAQLEHDASDVVSVGDLAYWPPMPAFCIFFGATPASRADEPRAAAKVNVFGRLSEVELDQLRSVRDGDKIVVKLVDRDA